MSILTHLDFKSSAGFPHPGLRRWSHDASAFESPERSFLLFAAAYPPPEMAKFLLQIAHRHHTAPAKTRATPAADIASSRQHGP